MGMKKRILSFTSALVMIMTFIVSSSGCSIDFGKPDDSHAEFDPAKDGVITNAEWIAMVNDAFGMQVDENDENGEIEAAKAWGVIGEDDEIDMEAPISEQFAARTMMRASGFVAPDATDEQIIQQAVAHGVITKEGSISDPQNAVAALGNLTNDWANIKYDYMADVNYSENVQDLTQAVCGEVKVGSDDEVVIPSDAAAGLSKDSVFVLPPNNKYDKGVALKVMSVSDNGNGTSTVKTVPASREEVYSDIYVQGSFNPDANSIVTYDTDAEIEVKDYATGMSFNAPHGPESGNIVQLGAYSKDAYIRQLKTEEFGANGCSINVSKKIGNVSYYVGIDNVKLNAKLDYTNTKVNEMRATIDYRSKCGVKYEEKLFEKKFKPGEHNFLNDPEAIVESYKIGNISFNIYYGISVDFTVYIVISASGAVSVEISQDHTKGFEWKNDKFRIINESGAPETTIKMSCTVGLNLKLELSLNLYLIKNYLECKLFAISIVVGPRLTGEIAVRNDMTCISVKGYVGLDFTAELDLIFTKYNQTISLWDSGNSPFKFPSLHFEITETEGFHKVDSCTHGAKVTTAPATSPVYDPAKKLQLEITYLSLKSGSTGVIGVKSSPVPESELVWKTSNPSVVKVDKTGRVMAVAKSGSAIIAVETPDKSQQAKCSVMVSPDYGSAGSGTPGSGSGNSGSGSGNSGSGNGNSGSGNGNSGSGNGNSGSGNGNSGSGNGGSGSGIGAPGTGTAADGSIESALEWAVAIANDDSHGYSQQNRQGPDYDCSSLVINALKNAGFNVGLATYTGNMRSELTQNGFTWIPWSSIGSMDNLQRGDILLNENKHTEFYIGNGKNVGAHSSYGHPETGDQDSREIRVSNYWDDNWDGVLRIVPVSPAPSQIPRQNLL